MQFGPDHTPYEELGGDERVRVLVDCFYDQMDRDEASRGIRSLHPASLADSRDKLYWFLSGWLGGPALYVERFGHPKLRARHVPFMIGAGERDQWLACMQVALDELEIDGALRTFLDDRFAHVATHMINQP